ncbi:hypothetical protein BD770DRAFT_392403 [Pilaira anomala]|nr:hypothetical protein BD770DRAFT_392403 [Pilaira anomala]
MFHITRRSTLRHGRVSHYGVKGIPRMLLIPNCEFDELCYTKEIYVARAFFSTR